MRSMNTRRERRATEAGFNLVEMMVVVVIAGILLAAAVPTMRERNAANRAIGAAHDLSSRMQWARQKAVARRLPYRMLIDHANRAYSFEYMDADSLWVSEEGASYAIEGVSAFDAELNGDAFDEDLEFEPRGTIALEDVPASFRFYSTEGDTAVLSLVRTGRIAISVHAD